ncbi:MAG TPA: hypothetical protein PK954_19020, partial [Anaerolineales bacterium]|nr:hypothetical protein [Anaerolineales bacterium]
GPESAPTSALIFNFARAQAAYHLESTPGQGPISGAQGAGAILDTALSREDQRHMHELIVRLLTAAADPTSA